MVLANTPDMMTPRQSGLTCDLPSGDLRDDYLPPNGHGTCVADILAGASYGVAKKTRLIVVKYGQDNCNPTVAGWNWVFNAILDDFKADRTAGNADYGIINFSSCRCFDT